MQYLKHFNKLFIIIIISLTLTACNKKISSNNNPNQEAPTEIKLEDSIVEEVKYSEVKINYANNETTFSFIITNTKETTLDIRYLFVKLLDENNNLISENEIFVGTSLANNETYPVSINVPLDFSSTAKAEYQLWDGVSPIFNDSV